jgi:hypothetical protein
MRALLIVATILTVASSAAFAGEIREFDIKTIEKLGNELTQIRKRNHVSSSNRALTCMRKHNREESSG